MNKDLRFELSFKDVAQLEKILHFCKINNINNINIPCKGLIKKEFFKTTFEYIKKNYEDFNVTYHYSLYHQYEKDKENSYQEFLGFIRKCNYIKNYQILLVSGSNKKKNFDVINVLENLKKENNLQVKLGIAYNPYLNKYFNNSSERNRFELKFSTGLVNSVWLQFGTDISLLRKEVNYLKNKIKDKNIYLFGSIFIPSKQFIARFKFRPWREVYISEKYLYSLENFEIFSKDLIEFYDENNIIPVIETDFFSAEKLASVTSFFKNKNKV